MARPSNAADNLTGHATKAEKDARKMAEEAALTGFPIRISPEVKKNRAATEEFNRVTELLTAAGKNDAIYEAVINDYCLYKGEINRYLTMRRKVERDKSLDIEKKCEMVLKLDKQIERFRAKRFAIEKENGFTIASALRAIPKKPEQKRDPLLDALRGDGDAD